MAVILSALPGTRSTEDLCPSLINVSLTERLAWCVDLISKNALLPITYFAG